ncbi:ABC transporter ATP-binding protein [Paenibacillus sp. DS2015]|uniref:ABC transporter ATP-binding protein n=1 Tax=Paenibacillus sp. DS2015 TaxID=3373917 RepID=UPI003D25C9CB
MWILSFYRSYPIRLFFILCFMVLFMLCELAIPYLMRIFIDDIFTTKDMVKFYNFCAIFIVPVVLMVVFKSIYDRLSCKLQERVSIKLQKKLLSKMRDLGVAYYENNQSGETLSIIQSSVDSATELYRKHLPQFMLQFSNMLVVFLYIMFFNIYFASIMIIAMIVNHFLSKHFGQKSIFWTEMETNNKITLERKIYDAVSAIPELRSYGSVEWSLREIQERTNEFVEISFKAHLYRHLRFLYRWIIINLGKMFVFIYGTVMVINGIMDYGEIITIVLYYVVFMNSYSIVVRNLWDQEISLNHSARLNNFMNIIPEVEEMKNQISMPDSKGTIELINVSFSYKNKPVVLEKINLTIKPGEKVAFVGMSGGGKSTILKLLTRNYDVSEGEIRINGIPIQQISFEEIRNQIGVVNQEIYLFGSSTIYENILFGNPHATESEVIEAAKAAYAHDFIMSLPNGYQTVVGERGFNLSGGQKQRIAIARVFLKRPSIILLDEATSALDSISEVEVDMAFKKLLDGRTTVTVAHRLSTVKDYDCLYIIENGKIVDSGCFNDLMKRSDKFKEIVLGPKGEAS